MAKIHIKDLSLRTIIGINDWEREKKQDILINIAIDFHPSKSIESDRIEDTLDYKALTKEIITMVESSEYFLLEKLADVILKIIMAHSEAQAADVTIDKPHALRFAKSVSVTLHAQR